MKLTHVVVADAGRARFLVVTKDAEGRTVLDEAQDLVNPDARLGGELFSTERSGQRRGDRGGAPHRLDDHRRRHLAEIDRRFARDVAAEVARRSEGKGKLVVVAAPHTLGLLRVALASTSGVPEDVVELRHDLSRLSVHALHEALATEAVVPGR